ncbi:MAG: vitamin B12-dependent ribonucleotide reductase, partial [Bacteroidia bacterium]|nr:vitamin B12-dependent ribonucleotide reductase [Bacteroidia bacterium]
MAKTIKTNAVEGKTKKEGLSIRRRFTKNNEDVYALFEYEKRSSVIRNPGGEVVYENREVEVPVKWSQVATDILAQKYFRKTGVKKQDGSMGGETSIREVTHRMVRCWTDWGLKYNYFNSEKDAAAFYDELAFMLLNQMAAPNSPQWFNTGLYNSYGIKGSAQGHFYVDPEDKKLKKSSSAYERPQPHACFILSVKDDLVNPGGIMDLWVREARIFKYGSGVGTNFSDLRGANEKLSGGGFSSGLMSFLKVGDRAAGAIKSGGTTRRAAKMVCLDIDHPEIELFINWKAEEEKKVAALMNEGYSAEYEGEAYATVSGQNSNNSVRISDAFMKALSEHKDWGLRARTDGSIYKSVPAESLWQQIAEAAWKCADPGLQFDTTINDWHTCPAGGRIRASNPCSEYMFLDDTACNLASLNLRSFFDTETQQFDVASFEHACRLWTIVLEISVLMAQFPSEEVAQNSYDYRTLGLGYANLGSLLMLSGLPYDSDKGRAIAAAITSLMTGVSYKTSAEMAGVLGAFDKYEANSQSMLRVLRNHRYAAYNTPDAFEGLDVKPAGIDPSFCPSYLLSASCKAWDEALQLGEKHGFRNAQVSVLAPTGTIGLLMDCDTTGVEPDFALVKFKKLSGGGYFKIVNQSVPGALGVLGYTEKQVNDIVQYVIGSGSFRESPGINIELLKKKGFSDEDILKLEKAAAASFDIRFMFTFFTLGAECYKRLGVEAGSYMDPQFDLLTHLGFSEPEIEAANAFVCGTMTVEGAPHLAEKDLPVFDCANRCGKTGNRFIAPLGHIRMMAAVQPFLSGAISKTVNLPNETGVDEIKYCYQMAWEKGLKAIAVYRDGCKLSQPLSARNGISVSAV